MICCSYLGVNPSPVFISMAPCGVRFAEHQLAAFVASWALATNLHVPAGGIQLQQDLSFMPRSSRFGRILPNPISVSPKNRVARAQWINQILHPMCKTLVKHMMIRWCDHENPTRITQYLPDFLVVHQHQKPPEEYIIMQCTTVTKWPTRNLWIISSCRSLLGFQLLANHLWHQRVPLIAFPHGLLGGTSLIFLNSHQFDYGIWALESV